MTTHDRPRRRTPIRTVGALAGVALVLVLTGCSGSGSGDSDSSAGAPAPAADGDASLASGAGLDAPEAATGSGAVKVADTVVQAAVISTGTVQIDDPDPAAVDREVDKIVATHNARITSEKSSTDDEGALTQATEVLRVPSAEFSSLVDDLKALRDDGTAVQAETKSEDVTTKVLDVNARVRAQERALQRVEALLDQAESLKDVMAVESEITQRQSDLDSLKSQQAYLADQTSMSTLTVFIDESNARPPEKKDEKDHNAFMAGLIGGWDSLSTLGAAIATVAGALLPFGVLLGVLALIAYFAFRPWLRRRGRTVALSGSE